jgi:hypothetical protein
MAEILAALLYCNLETNEEGKYNLKPSAGRLTAGAIRLLLIGGCAFLYFHG